MKGESVCYFSRVLCDLIDCSLPGSSVHGILQAKNTGVGSPSLPSPGDLPNPRIEPGASCVAGRFFTI